jgi:hypothetical protein
MVAFVVGLLLAIIFLGLPLGIIGLFVLSIIDQISPEVGDAPQDAGDFRRSAQVTHSPDRRPAPEPAHSQAAPQKAQAAMQHVLVSGPAARSDRR